MDGQSAELVSGDVARQLAGSKAGEARGDITMSGTHHGPLAAGVGLDELNLLVHALVVGDGMAVVSRG